MGVILADAPLREGATRSCDRYDLAAAATRTKMGTKDSRYLWTIRVIAGVDD
jgi:hypothetical protein